MQTISPPPKGNDRLGSTLFVAALVHGVVILGVTFTVSSIDDKTVPVLNVALVVDSGKREAAVDTADFLSNRNQRAAGQAAKGQRPTTALSAAQPVTRNGDPQGADATDVSFSRWRSMKPVSILFLRTSGCVTSAERNGMLVTTPRTSVSSRPRLRRLIAPSRVGAQAITFASIAS